MNLNLENLITEAKNDVSLKVRKISEDIGKNLTAGIVFEAEKNDMEKKRKNSDDLSTKLDNLGNKDKNEAKEVLGISPNNNFNDFEG